MARSIFTNCFSTFAFGVGMVTTVVAAVFWIMSKTTDGWLTNWIPLVLIAAFGLFVLGAHCLDVSERNDHKASK